MANAPVELRDGVIEIDTRLGGWEKRTAGYLISGPAPLLIETGSQSSVPVVKAALEALGIGADDLAGIAVTHIHLDHAGGVGDLARAFPKARVYVHELGARHLVDPTRLVDSAGRVYGELLDSLYGRLDPTPQARITVLADNDAIEIGPGHQVLAINSPGHAKHHLGFIDSTSGLLFAGDAVGVKLPGGGVLRPATPPADFDLELAIGSLARFSEKRPSRICLAHYGLIEQAPEQLLAEAEQRLRSWAEVAERAYRAGEDIETALRAHFEDDFEQFSEKDRERIEMLNGIHSNAAGLYRWLSTREDGADKAPPQGAAPASDPSHWHR